MSGFVRGLQIGYRWYLDHTQPAADALSLSVSKHMNINHTDLDEYVISHAPIPSMTSTDPLSPGASAPSVQCASVCDDSEYDFDSVDESCIDLQSLRILTFNVWGLPISPLCELRVAEFENLFSSYDILCFQECAHPREIKSLIRKAHEEYGLYYHHWFRQGIGFPIWKDITGPGLLVLSRFPIRHVEFKRYSINGAVHQVQHSDFMGAKGVGFLRIDLSAHPQCRHSSSKAPQTLELFITHLHANYTNYSYDTYRHLHAKAQKKSKSQSGPASAAIDGDGELDGGIDDDEDFEDLYPDEYIGHRLAQAYELARFIVANRSANSLVVLAGDINAPAYDIVVHMLRALTQLTDAYGALHPCVPGYTSSAPDNTFSTLFEEYMREKEKYDKQIHVNGNANGNGTSTNHPSIGQEDEVLAAPVPIASASTSNPAPSPSSTPFLSSSSSSSLSASYSAAAAAISSLSLSMSSIRHHLTHPSAIINQIIRRFLLEKKKGDLPRRIDYLLFQSPTAAVQQPFPLNALSISPVDTFQSVHLVECKVIKPYFLLSSSPSSTSPSSTDEKYSFSDHWGVGAKFQLLSSVDSTRLPISSVSGEISVWQRRKCLLLEREIDLKTVTAMQVMPLALQQKRIFDELEVFALEKKLGEMNAISSAAAAVAATATGSDSELSGSESGGEGMNGSRRFPFINQKEVEDRLKKLKAERKQKKKKKKTDHDQLVSGKMTVLSPSQSSPSLSFFNSAASASSTFSPFFTNFPTSSSSSSSSPIPLSPMSPLPLPDLAPQSLPPPLLSLFALSKEILHDSVADVGERRKRHLRRMTIAIVVFCLCRIFGLFVVETSPLAQALLHMLNIIVCLLTAFAAAIAEAFILLSVTPFVQFFGSFFSTSGFAALLLSPPSSALALSVVSFLCSFLQLFDYVIPGYGWTAFILSTFFLREEQTAVRQVLAEMNCDAYAMRREIALRSKQHKELESFSLDTAHNRSVHAHSANTSSGLDRQADPLKAEADLTKIGNGK